MPHMWTCRKLSRIGTSALVVGMCMISLLPSTGAAYGRRCSVGRGARTVRSSNDALIVARTERYYTSYIGCWRPTARVMTIARVPLGRRKSTAQVGFAISGSWIVVERAAGASCDARKTLRSLDIADGRQGYEVLTQTCLIGSPGEQDNKSVTLEGPWPPTVLDNGPAPVVRNGVILNLAIATNGNFAWTATGNTHLGSFDRATFGTVASGLFVPTGGMHDTNLSIVRSSKFPAVHMMNSMLSWTQFGAVRTYTMPNPREPVLPIRIQGPQPRVGYTPPPPPTIG
jgi:hypothetical protein